MNYVIVVAPLMWIIIMDTVNLKLSLPNASPKVRKAVADILIDLAPIVTQRVVEARDKASARLVESLLEGVTSAEPGFIDWFIAESAKTSVDALARFVPMMRQYEVLEDLHRIRCPTLAIAPGGDPIHKVEHYRVLQERIHDCEFVVYEGLPHNITDSVPDRCAKDYRRFLLAHAGAT